MSRKLWILLHVLHQGIFERLQILSDSIGRSVTEMHNCLLNYFKNTENVGRHILRDRWNMANHLLKNSQSNFDLPFWHLLWLNRLLRDHFLLIKVWRKTTALYRFLSRSILRLVLTNEWRFLSALLLSGV